MAAAALALTKLLLGTAIFVVLGYLGRFHDKRIAGVLLTFPILNGIGILTGAEPLAVAHSIYAVVVFNGLLLFSMISLCTVVAPNTSAAARLVSRLALWTAVWIVGAPLVIVFRDALPGAAGLLAIQCVIAAVAARWFWVAPRGPARDAPPDAPPTRAGHGRALVALWRNPAGFFRIGLFAACAVLLLAAAQLYPSRWVGMLSALPLPGLFAVATLSVMDKREDFLPLRDSVLFGPPTVIVFNWLFAHVVARLPDAPGWHALLGIVALVALLAADARAIFWIVPRISAYLDTQRPNEQR